MLVLTRKCKESVVVGAPNFYERLLKVTVLDIRRGCVKLGFEADSDVAVHRWEIWERIRAKRPAD
jgi:carbon storage regulator CsrA